MADYQYFLIECYIVVLRPIFHPSIFQTQTQWQTLPWQRHVFRAAVRHTEGRWAWPPVGWSASAGICKSHTTTPTAHRTTSASKARHLNGRMVSLGHTAGTWPLWGCLDMSHGQGPRAVSPRSQLAAFTGMPQMVGVVRPVHWFFHFIHRQVLWLQITYFQDGLMWLQHEPVRWCPLVAAVMPHLLIFLHQGPEGELLQEPGWCWSPMVLHHWPQSENGLLHEHSQVWPWISCDWRYETKHLNDLLLSWGSA